MLHSKLIGLLETFSARDFRRFGEYLDSPFFNKRKDLRDFYASLRLFAPDFAGAQLSKEALWAAYGGWQPLDEKELGYLMNFLLGHAENYLAVEALEADVNTKGHRSMSHYLVQGLDKHYLSAANRNRKALLASPHQDAEWHLRAWRLADLKQQHLYSAKSRKRDGSTEAAVRHLDAFYLGKRLEMASEALNLSQILESQADLQAVDNLLEYASAMAEPPLNVRVWLLVTRLLRHPEDGASFGKLKDMLVQVPEVFSPEKAKGVFAHAQNHCIRRIKAGHLEFQQELFGIYKTALATGLMHQGKYLSPWSFKNVCSVALKLGEFAWVKAFIAEQAERVAPEFRANGVAYNLANLHFHQGNFKAAMQSLREVGFQDVFYALDTRRMMLMVYFEREDAEALHGLASAFRTYLRRNKVVSAQNRKAYKNFVDWAVRIFKAKQKRDAKVLIQYQGEIAQVTPLVEGEWLLENAALTRK